MFYGISGCVLYVVRQQMNYGWHDRMSLLFFYIIFVYVSVMPVWWDVVGVFMSNCI